MTKELEEIKTLRGFNQVELNNDKNINKSLDIIEQALQRLEAIDNAEPSEALESLERVKGYYAGGIISVEVYLEETEEYNTVKQALLKAQKQEKVLEIIFEKNVEIYWLKHSKTVEEYNKHIKNLRDTFNLTQEEFDTLKRWI